MCKIFLLYAANLGVNENKRLDYLLCLKQRQKSYIRAPVLQDIPAFCQGNASDMGGDMGIPGKTLSTLCGFHFVGSWSSRLRANSPSGKLAYILRTRLRRRVGQS